MYILIIVRHTITHQEGYFVHSSIWECQSSLAGGSTTPRTQAEARGDDHPRLGFACCLKFHCSSIYEGFHKWGGTWRIIPLSKWLVTGVSSPTYK